MIRKVKITEVQQHRAFCECLKKKNIKATGRRNKNL